MKLAKRLRTMTFCIPFLGCLNGDFGRVKQSLVIDDIHAWLGRDAALQQGMAGSAGSRSFLNTASAGSSSMTGGLSIR